MALLHSFSGFSFLRTKAKLPAALQGLVDQPPPISLASSDRLAHGCLRGIVGLPACADASPGDVALSLAPHTRFRPSARPPSVVPSGTGKCQACGLGPKDCLLCHTGRGHRHGTLCVHSVCTAHPESRPEVPGLKGTNSQLKTRKKEALGV